MGISRALWLGAPPLQNNNLALYHREQSTAGDEARAAALLITGEMANLSRKDSIPRRYYRICGRDVKCGRRRGISTSRIANSKTGISFPEGLIVLLTQNRRLQASSAKLEILCSSQVHSFS
ncbi:hypothetical protein J6590_070418 [Homalodisca vitripennis]|nr:hypothetical protein J6590_070418 [Homalodisca vitripennis]